jgi:hypothetical protein
VHEAIVKSSIADTRDDRCDYGQNLRQINELTEAFRAERPARMWVLEPLCSGLSVHSADHLSVSSLHGSF